MVTTARSVKTKIVDHAVVESPVPRVAPQPKVRLRPIALPSEHGGWGMLGAPIFAGLLLSPSWAGALVALAGIGVFLTRQPFRLALTDMRKGKRYPRTQWAIRFAALFAGLGTLALLGGAMLASAPFYAPLLGAAALGALQFSFDIRGEGRRFVPEVCGATAMAMFGVAIAQSGGLSGAKPWLIGLLLALQFGTAIPYAAARVRLARGVSVNRTPVYAGHLASLAIVGALAATGITGWPIAVAFALLSARAVWGLSCHHRQVRAATVGIQEVAYTILCVAAMVLSI